MNPLLVATILIVYFLILIAISFWTSQDSTPNDFFNASRSSKWYLVAFGMIGASLSGVTFLSVPGEIVNSHFYYFQVVLGYFVGYWVISHVLLPLYYKLALTSIYTYLHERFGFWSYKMGASFFLISRVIGASFRLFLVASVLHISIFQFYDLPFWVAVMATLFLIWLYTFRGGIKTIIITDTLQTALMLLAAVFTIGYIKTTLDWSWGDAYSQVVGNDKTAIFNWDWQDKYYFFKQFFAGVFIAIVMTGLDQDMMQKNLTCKTLSEAQKNMFWFSVSLIFVNLLFLILGVFLYLYADHIGIALPSRTDNIFPLLATQHFSIMGGVIFLLGITAAAYSSADSALTALTTSFCIDFLGFQKTDYEKRKKARMGIHFIFSLLIFAVVLIFNAINDQSVITAIFIAAGYTYGPLLGLFSFGIFTKKSISDRHAPWVCILSPMCAYMISQNSQQWFNGYQFGFEILILNGILTFLGLVLISKRRKSASV